MAECLALNRTFIQPTLRLGDSWKGQKECTGQKKGKGLSKAWPRQPLQYELTAAVSIMDGGGSHSPDPFLDYWLWMNFSGQDQSAMD